MGTTKPSNDEIAEVLEQIADLLEVQEANLFRIRAYRNAAQSVRASEESVARLVKEHQMEEVQDLPNVGEGLASTIAEFVSTGRVGLLDRLQGELSPEDVFQQVPGIGEDLAQRIAQNLDIHSLEELEQAAHDGRLKKVEGFGEKRLKSVQMSLAGMLSQSAMKKARKRESEGETKNKPSIKVLLSVDQKYRQKAEQGKLKKIAPRRFNPEGKAWLPIMHTKQEGWSFTVLYSNTAKAHDLGKVRDWVVIYFENKGSEDQCTVVTETSGSLKGKRVVRGREAECRDYYQSSD